jgi:hypothetical protein
MTLKSVVAQRARYPYGVNTYESMSDQIKTGQIKNGMSDKAMVQLRHAQAYQKKTYKQKAKSLALTNQWNVMDKQLKYKNEYEKVIDELKNTKLKGLTHEQLESKEKHLEKLFKDTIR